MKNKSLLSSLLSFVGKICLSLSLSLCLALTTVAFDKGQAYAAPVKKTNKAHTKKASKQPTKKIAIKRKAAPAAVRTQRVSAKNNTRIAKIAPAVPTVGMLHGLHHTQDPLELKSSVALVVDLNNNTRLFEKNAQAVLPIASLTKLMTALVVLDSLQTMEDFVAIEEEDTQLDKYSRSRLTVGTTLTRKQALHLALMSSENRAANALSRFYPGGKTAFVKAMNLRAKSLGMNDTFYTEATGLSNRNVSSANDLVLLLRAALNYPTLQALSTSREESITLGNGRVIEFHNTNRLTANAEWDIRLQKTGFISEAGQCLIMVTRIDGRDIAMVFLDSQGKLSRLGDAQRVRDALQQNRLQAFSPAGQSKL